MIKHSWMGLATLLLSTVSYAAPGWGFDNTYEEMMRSFDSIKPPFENIDNMIGDFGDNFDRNLGMMGSSIESFGNSLEDHFEQVSDQMEKHFGKIGSQMNRRMNQMGDSLGQHMNSAGETIDQIGSQIQNSFNHEVGNFNNNLDMFGTRLLGRIDDGLANIPFGGNVDVYSMFGKTKTPWWKKENVCSKREVLEEDDDVPNQNSKGSSYHMQVNQCIEGEDFYECTNTLADDGVVKTLRVVYSCCHGFKRVSGGACSEVDMKPLEESIEELGGKEFLNLVVENQLDSLLNNVTLFVPTDEAVEDFMKDMEELQLFEQPENIVYNIDDGLAYKRKKRSVMVVQETGLEDMQNILAGHMIQGFVTTKDMKTEELITSFNVDNDEIRITTYPTKPETTIMANCAKVTSKDNYATNGVIHMVNKVIAPAKNTIFDILAADDQFKTFKGALEAKGLNEMLSKAGHYTVFAPTDEAFEKLDELTKEKVLGNGGCSGDIIQSHILPSVICSSIVERRVKVHNVLGRNMFLNIDEEGNVHVEGIKLMMKDKMTTNGVIHVIEDVIIQDSVVSVVDHLKKKNANKLLDILEKSQLIETVEGLSNLTFFAPSEKALSEIPKQLMDELVKDKKRLEEILLHHITTEGKGSCHFSNNEQLTTAGGKKLRINLHKHFGHMLPLGTVQCARIIENDGNVCGGKVHIIDRVLTPPSGNIVETLKKDHTKFMKLIEFAGLEGELSDDMNTVLAPLDAAFDKLDENVASKIFEDKELAEKVVKKHVLADSVCCAAIPRSSGFFQSSLRKASRSGERVSIRRSNGGHIYANNAAISRCDLAATNGIIHSVDTLLLPESMMRKDQNGGQKFWMF